MMKQTSWGATTTTKRMDAGIAGIGECFSLEFNKSETFVNKNSRVKNKWLEARKEVGKTIVQNKVFAVNFDLGVQPKGDDSLYPQIGSLITKNKLIGRKSLKPRWRLLFDSGASVSLISNNFLKNLQSIAEEGDLLVEDADAGFAKTAGGGSLKFMPYVVSFELRFGDITIVFCRARVHDQNSSTCLLGQSDLP